MIFIYDTYTYYRQGPHPRNFLSSIKGKKFLNLIVAIIGVLWFNRRMKIKARINKDGLMGSASREHKVKKGKGSFKRREKHQKNACH